MRPKVGENLPNVLIRAELYGVDATRHIIKGDDVEHVVRIHTHFWRRLV